MPEVEQPQRLPLARIVRTQGRKGEVLADLLTDFPDQFTASAHLLLVAPDGAARPATVENFWMPTGRSAGRIVLKIAGVESISDAEALTGYSIELPRTERLALEDGSYYVSDLVGCTVTEGEQTLGTVQDIHFPLSPEGRRLEDAAPLFVVERPGGDELLVPFANAYVEAIDLAERSIALKLPAGMLELNG